MNQAKAALLYNSPISLVVRAARVCTDSLEKSDTVTGSDMLGPVDEKFMRERIMKTGKFDVMNPAHESVIEHAVYTFELWFSRAVLQELSRHRIASPSVQSTRFALKKLVKKMAQSQDLSEFLTFTGDEEIDRGIIEQTKIMIAQVKKEKPNDKTKFLITDAFRTREMLTINARSLRNLFVLRTSSHALWEIRQLAFAMVDVIPRSHRFLFEDRIHERPEGY